MCSVITKMSMKSEYTFTHMKLWKESGIVDKRRIKGYSSSQVARKSSSPVPAPGIIEIRLESARAHATSFYSVNCRSAHGSAVSAIRIEMDP